MMDKRLNARLPDGTMFDFWERTLYVACDDAAASDNNDGS